ncbi:MAG: flagellar basal body-associated FliL family protein [Deltaproteobacteria bacterium]|nr:flagellar basal body-associated FliL family protein [Deltaproteobacteria bacterium]
MSDTASSESAPKPAKAKSIGTILGIVGLGLAIVNLGATAFVIMTLQHPIVVEAKPVEVAHSSLPADGPLTPLDSFVVNLNERGSARYLKATMDVQVAQKEAVDDIERAKPAIRDSLLRYLSSLSVEDTSGEEAKIKIQKQLIARVEKIIGEGKIHKLYFQEFVVQ